MNLVPTVIEQSSHVGTVVTSLVIARPHSDIQKIVAQYKVTE